MEETPALMKHIEDHLGPILAGWTTDPDGNKQPFQIVICNSPVAGAKVLLTLGLSSKPLWTEAQGLRRQEMLMMFRETDKPRSLPVVLQELALQAWSRDQAFALGDVIGPRGPIVEGGTVSAFFVAPPAYLPESFAFVRGIGPVRATVLFGWLVPIAETEAAFVRANGAEAFEDELMSSSPDLLDFRRASIV